MLLRAGRPSPCGEHAGPLLRVREPACVRATRHRNPRSLTRRLRVDAADVKTSAIAETASRSEPVSRADGGPRRFQVVVAERSVGAASAKLRAKGAPMCAACDFFMDLCMPPGWPQSTSADFLPYVSYGLPTHICGWIMHSMTTTSLLRAVGAEPGTAAVAATSAAIKWLSKDGLGALGRLLVGSRLGIAPDIDPKLMRMYAELIALMGSALELSTGFFPQYFFVTAGLASALRTVGKGISSPAHTAFRLHFARDNNIGAVCAKEEVFEVAAELCGLATSVLILQSGVTQREDSIVIAWVLAATTHFTCRYLAIRSLNLEEVNCKRAVLLARHFVREGRVPSAAELSAEEPVLLPVELVAPRIHIGCKLHDALPTLVERPAGEKEGALEPLRWGAELAASARGGGEGRVGSGGEVVCSEATCEATAAMYEDERYVLTSRGGSVYIALREDAGTQDILKAVWQAVALEQGGLALEESLTAANDPMAGGRAFAKSVAEAGWKPDMLMKELESRQRFRVDGGQAPLEEQQLAPAAR